METQIVQSRNFTPVIKSLCEAIIEDIPGFDPHSFVEHHYLSVTHQALQDTLEEVLEKGRDKKDPSAFAEQTLKRNALAYPIKSKAALSPAGCVTSTSPTLPKERVKDPANEQATLGTVRQDEKHPGKGIIQNPSETPRATATEEEPVVPFGSFLIARKIFSSKVWLKDPLYLKVWIWVIGQARYQEQEMKAHRCERGEFVTTYHEIIQGVSHYHNREYKAPTLKQVRSILKWFRNEGMVKFLPIREKSFPTGADTGAETGAYLGIKIVVLNYETYQNTESYKGRHRGRRFCELGQTLNNKDKKELKKRIPKNPSEISDEISALVSKLFPSQEEKKLFDLVREAISSTRKGGRVSDSVILGQLKAWEKYPVHQVHAGIRIYLEKGYHREGEGEKGERYLLGIIRNHRPRTEPRQEKGKPSGSAGYDRALKNYYEGRLKIKPTMMSGNQGGTS